MENTGDRAGAQVVQFYIAPPESANVNRPVKELKGFHKVFLQPGEKKEIEVELDVQRATSYWNEHTGSWCSEAGTYRVLVGDSSAPGALLLEQELVVEETTYWSGL